MRCKDVRRWITRSDQQVSPELTEHIARCPSCSRAASAHRSLNQLLETMKGDEPVTALSAIRKQVETASAQQSNLEKIMMRIKDQISVRPRILAGVGLAMIAFLFVTLVPFSFTHTAGYSVSFAGSESDKQVSLEVVEKAVNEAAVKDVAIVMSRVGDSVEYSVLRLPTVQVANHLALAIEKSVDSAVILRVNPDRQIVTGPLYAQVVSRVAKDKDKPVTVSVKPFPGQFLFKDNAFFEIIDDLELSDSEVVAKVTDRLVELGLEADAFTVSCETDAEAQARSVDLTMVSDSTGRGEAEADLLIVRDLSNSLQRRYVIRAVKDSALKVDSLGKVAPDGRKVMIKVSLKDKVR